MLNLKKVFFIAATLAVTAVPAFADSLDRGRPSNFAVWAFLALCGLIIVAQVLPLIRRVNEETEVMAAKAQEKRKLETH